MQGARDDDGIRKLASRLREGGEQKYHDKNAEKGKLFCRERIALLCDAGSFVEDGLFANCLAGDLPADGVVTGVARVDGRPVAMVASDSTVKAGSWGARTVEKILRIQERSSRDRIPIFYLVDSAGARITDQVEMFPGRRGAGRIFFNQAHLSGRVPQICVLFGPSAAGGAYIPAFCDVVFMVEGNAAMYLGSPRMAEMVIGEKVDVEEMGGAGMHTAVSGCADFLCPDERTAVHLARSYFRFFPQSYAERSPVVESKPPMPDRRRIGDVVGVDERKGYDVRDVIRALVDEDSFLEIKERYAKELVTGLTRIEGRAVGVVANQPMHKGGVLFVESAGKAARFVRLCDAFDIPLLFLADVPGFMIGSKVERQGIIRAGAKMIAAVSEASVPKLSVVLRKAYGAGLYAMCGPAFEPDACIALPTASIAVMSPEAAVNAVFYNKIQAIPEEEREEFVEEERRRYAEDVDLSKLASELVVDAVVAAEDLRREISMRLSLVENKNLELSRKKHSIDPI